MWAEGVEVVVANRSWDPIWVSMYLNDKEHRDAGSNMVTYVFWGVVPPCMATRVPDDLVYLKASGRSAGRNTEWRVQGLHFRTASGESWVRQNNGSLGEASEVPEAMRQQSAVDALISLDKAKRSALPDCRML